MSRNLPPKMEYPFIFQLHSQDDRKAVAGAGTSKIQECTQHTIGLTAKGYRARLYTARMQHKQGREQIPLTTLE